jgi:hypothetical protein
MSNVLPAAASSISFGANYSNKAEIANPPFNDEPGDHLVRRMLMEDLFLILGPKSQMSSLLVRRCHFPPAAPHTDSPRPAILAEPKPC